MITFCGCSSQRVTIAESSPPELSQSPKATPDVSPSVQSTTAAEDTQMPSRSLKSQSKPAPTATDASAKPEIDAPKTAPSAKKDIRQKPLPRTLNAHTNASCGKDPGVGKRLQSFTLKTPEGKTIRPSQYRGRVLLINFWGTWCKPCLKELPEFDRLYRHYRNNGLTLIAIATDENAEDVKDFVNNHHIKAKVAIGGEEHAGLYGSSQFPFSFVVDRKGIIRAAYSGYRLECAGQLEADIREQLMSQ